MHDRYAKCTLMGALADTMYHAEPVMHLEDTQLCLKMYALHITLISQIVALPACCTYIM